MDRLSDMSRPGHNPENGRTATMSLVPQGIPPRASNGAVDDLENDPASGLDISSETGVERTGQPTPGESPGRRHLTVGSDPKESTMHKRSVVANRHVDSTGRRSDNVSGGAAAIDG